MAKIDFTNGAAPATPAVGKVSLYTKADKKIYIKDDAGTETPLIDAGIASITALTGDVTATGPGSVVATIAAGAVTNAKVASGIDAVKIGAGSVDNTEFGYLNGVTSQLQVQLDNIVSSVNDRVPFVGALADINLGNTQRIINLVDPASAQDAATKNYVDTGLGSFYVPYTGATADIVLGTRNIRMASGEMLDAGGFSAIQINNRALKTAAGIPNLQWGTYEMFDSTGTLCQDWDNRHLIDALAARSLSYSSRDLVSGGVNLLNWDGAVTINDSGGATSAQFTSRALYDSSLASSVNWGGRQLVDNSSVKAMEWTASSRQLFDFGGSYPSIDYGNYWLMNIGITNTVPLLDWSTSAGGSVVIYNGYLASPVANFSAGAFYNVGDGSLTQNFSDRLLFDDYGQTSLDWNYHILSFLGDTRVHWESGYLGYSGGCYLSWAVGVMQDSSSVDSIQWNSRILYNTAGTTLVDWTGTALVLFGQPATNAGSIWQNTFRKSFSTYNAGVEQILQGVIAVQTATGTAANTTAETTISSTVQGTLTLPANFFTTSKTLRIKGAGFHSSTASPTLNFKVKFGSTVISTTGAHTHHNATNGYWEFETTITCRTTGASGTVFAQGRFFDATDTVSMVNLATISINTTTSQAITCTAQWSAASVSNTISMTNLTVEVLN